MFGNINKSTFGAAAPSTSFGGFGATPPANANPFGQGQLFGKPATGGFGSPSTSTFGQPANTSLFPSTQAQPTSLFPNANTSFGGPPSTQSGFGTTNLFGPQQPSSTVLFNTTSTFGQQSKPTGFGFGTPSTQPSLFGQQAQQAQTSSIFQPTTTSLFGGATAFGGQHSTGTVVKFNPVTGSDTMMKNGVAQSINTKHHSITCMKEYENKSFEELRFEDYGANRKGPQQQTGFGTTPFGATASTAPTLFGQPDASKSAFGQTTGFGQSTNTFGQTTGFGIANQQQQAAGIFGKPTGFGAPTSSAPTLNFGFGSPAQTANPFGPNQATKPFGSATPSIFGTNTNTTQQSGFGTGIFGQTNTQNATSLFPKPAQPATGFGTGQGTTGFSFATPATTQSSLFQQNKPLFGQQTTNTGFGQSNSFGTSNTTSFASSFKSATPAFGATQTPGFGSSLGMQPQGSSFFGNTAAKPGIFGNPGSTGVFGNINNTFQPNTGFGLQQQQPQQSLFPPPEQQPSPNFAMLTTDPFGDAPHLAGLEPKSKSLPAVSATDPKELKSLLDASKKVDTSNSSKLKVVPIKSVRDSLFDDVSLKFKNDGNSGEYVKTNCRRLVLKHRPSSSGDGHSPGIVRTDILKYIMSDEKENNNNEGNTTESDIPNFQSAAPLRLNFEHTDNADQISHIGSQTYLLNNSHLANGTTEKSVSPDLDIEDEDSNAVPPTSDTTKIYPCGIICTRPEYYTLPGLDELTQHVDENGSCIIKGFTIGRKGYGNVYFPDEMDVAGLNIDELVHFRYREINVYPDDCKKPPIGQGLNRKAQITLDNVYPRRVGTNTLIKDVGELLEMNFAEKLRKVTVKKDAKFIDYRPETGSWVFKVDHFSRYGFDESDEESEQNGNEVGKKKEGPKKSEVGLQGQKTTEELVKLEALKQTEIGKEIQVSTLGMDNDIFIEEGDHFEGDDVFQQSMYVDNISEEDYHTIPTDVPMHLDYDTYKIANNIQVMKSTLFADDDRFSDGGESHVSIIRQFLDLPEEIPRLVKMRNEVVPEKKAIMRPNVEKIYNFGGSDMSTGLLPYRSYQDLGIFKGKSYKIGWAKGFSFYNLQSRQGEVNGQLAVNTIECGTRKSIDPLKDCLDDSLEIVLEESSFKLDENNIPTFNIRKNSFYLQKQTRLFSTLLVKYNNKEAHYLHSIWTLVEALWGPCEETIANRRHLVSEWVKSNTAYNDISINSGTKDIFNLLSIFRIHEAAILASEKKYPNLSLIISQLSLTNRTKLFLQEQIESWAKSMTENHINDEMKKIYLLLSGTPIKDSVNIFQGIDWKRAFGMHLWYVSPVGAPLEMAIELYKKAFEEQGYAELPNPPHRCDYVEEGAFDVLYHILMLYKTKVHRLSSTLNPATHTNDLLDYRLSWLLLQLFLSLDVGIIETSEKNKLCTSFSNQLESLGEWEWAIFVLLHLEDNVLKKNIVMGILDRNLSPDVDKATLDSENNLVNRMHIPPEWIHSVKGNKTLLLQRNFEAFNHFAYARDYFMANDILVEHLLPILFINEQYDIIKTLIQAINDGANYITRWNCEAGLFSDFVALQELDISCKADDLLKLQMKLQSISDRIASFPIKTDQQKLCIAEMSKRCASVYKEMCKKSSGLFKNSYSDFIETLVMPPDFKQNEASYLISEFNSIRC